MKQIEINLNDEGSLKKAIKDLEKYKRLLERRTQLLVKKLTDEGAKIARIKIVRLGAYYSGELLSGVDGYYSPALRAGFVRVTSDHVAFVEFGTGVVGQNNSHSRGILLQFLF